MKVLCSSLLIKNTVNGKEIELKFYEFKGDLKISQNKKNWSL